MNIDRILFTTCFIVLGFVMVNFFLIKNTYPPELTVKIGGTGHSGETLRLRLRIQGMEKEQKALKERKQHDYNLLGNRVETLENYVINFTVQ